MRILYIDDDRINTLLFEQVCQMAGSLEVATAGTGAEAVQVACEFLPEVLVVDLHLPDTDGFELLSRLRTEAGMAGVPAFLCSADEPAEIEPDALRAGYAGCWSKPVDVNHLLAELGRIAGLAAAPRLPRRP